jgi:hypothetical protein
MIHEVMEGLIEIWGKQCVIYFFVVHHALSAHFSESVKLRSMFCFSFQSTNPEAGNLDNGWEIKIAIIY